MAEATGGIHRQQRFIIISFDSMDKAKAWNASARAKGSQRHPDESRRSRVLSWRTARCNKRPQSIVGNNRAPTGDDPSSFFRRGGSKGRPYMHKTQLLLHVFG